MTDPTGPAQPAPTMTKTAPAAVRPPAQSARTVEDFDTSAKAKRDEAGSAAGAYLGQTVASLGDASEPGIWMKTPLVSSPGKGRVDNVETGASVTVDLIPLKGPKSAGSQLSLAAFRLIKAPITGLPTLKVYKAGG